MNTRPIQLPPAVKSGILLKQFMAICVVDAGVRRIVFEATGHEEARTLAQKLGLGLEGEIQAIPTAPVPDRAEKSAFDTETACEKLGGISRTSLYRLLLAGKVQRLSGIRKVLVTRDSIDRYSRPTAR